MNDIMHILRQEKRVKLPKRAQVKQLMLTHLPQHGSLEQLREEAQNYAGTEIPVTLALTRFNS